MLIKDLQNCEEIIAGDNSILREVLHPKNEKLQIRYSLAHAIIKPGETSLPHKLKTSEVYYILEGEGIMYIENESEKVHSNQAVYIPPNAKQYIKNTGNSDLKFLCLVDPAWRPEDEEVV
ncbi:MAG: cupin domain-containing protein [Patescibacteria group bacterium]|nr:cupin domain-containing protein [Patescibacteria group bacterium]MDD5294791.1 cupin domain-containing protein [Patescibacteria group bacterium]MDD5554289.1 cupin domain-containing protein [Patescibacteria group bacterium]